MRDLVRSAPIRLVLLIHFFWHLASATLLILPKWLHGLAYPESHIGLVVGAAGISGLAFTPLIGGLLDRVDRVRVLRFSTALAAPAILLLPYCAAFGGAWLGVLRIVQGVAFSISFPCAGTLIADFSRPSVRVRALGLFGIVTQLTQAAGPGLGEWAAAVWGYDVLFFLAAGGAAAACAATFRLEQVVRRHGRPEHHDEAGEDTGNGEPAARLPLSAFVLATGVTYGAMITFVPVLLLHLGVAAVAPFFVAVSLSSATVRALFGGLGDRVDRDRLISLSGAGITLATAAAAVAAAAAPGPPAARAFGILGGLVFGAATGFYYPVANVRFVELGPAVERGKRMAYFSATYAGGITGGNLVLGYLAQYGGFAVMYACVALVHLATAAWFFAAGRRRG